MYNPFKKKPKIEKIVEITPMERAQRAVDELNAAVAALREATTEGPILRPWVRSGDARYRIRAKVMLGYWCPHKSGFVTVYGDDQPGTKDY